MSDRRLARQKGQDATPRQALPFDALTVPLDQGVTMVEASAGTGKTFAITRLVLRLLLERRVDDISRILVVTFTEKATQELVTRIRGVLRLAEQVWSDTPPERRADTDDLFALRDAHGDDGREVIQRALASLDDLAVSTIHGFCQRILSESALESRIPFRTTFIEDESEPFGRAARDWARRRLIHNSADARIAVEGKMDLAKWVKDVVAPYRRQRNARIEYDRDARAQFLVADFVQAVDRSFESEKERRHLLGFDDLLEKLSRVLRAEGPQGALANRIRARFSAALIDEFQDTDQTQFPIFTNAFEGCPLFLIGDPKQSIYRFRGADIHAYLDAARRAERKYTLLANYRSTAAYVKAVEALFTRARDPFLVSEDEIDFPRVKAALDPRLPGKLASDGGAAMEWWWIDPSLVDGAKSISKEKALLYAVREVTNEIVRLGIDGLPYGSIAVLVRTNKQALQFKSALDRARVPSVIAGDADVLASEEADELVRLAVAIAAPHESFAVRSAMATRLWGCDAPEIAATLRPDGERDWAKLTDRLVEAREAWRTRGIGVAIGELLAERRSAERLLSLPDGERRLTNVRHVMELFHDAWAADGIAPEGFGAWVARERVVPNTPGRRELRLETDSEAVQILTIHKAKGLQFDVVFAPTLWGASREQKGPLGVDYALAREDGGAVLDLGTPQRAERREAQDREDDAEELRLAYVALTRAVHRCYVVWGVIGTRESSSVHSPLGHLMRTESGEVEREALRALVVAAGGTMAVRDVTRGVPWRVANPTGSMAAIAEPQALQLAPRQLDTWRLASFTGLVTDAHSEESRDVADPLLVPPLAGEREAASGFRAFPAGRQGGIALHDVFESLDFRRAGEGRTREMVQRTLERHGLVASTPEGAQRVDDVMQMLQAVSTAPVPGASFALADVPVRDSLREWRFHVSVQSASVRRMADVLAMHGSAHAREYAPVLRMLRDSALGGYLSGVVDIAFEHQGRWWLMDWKSNDLGEGDESYHPEALSKAMMQAHYTLQYHLYLLALHRHLQLRHPGYDPARDWGGVAYVFLRGVDGVSDRGWFRDAPTPELLEALDAALGRRR